MATTCLSFPQNDVNNFLVGSEEGTVYSACRHGSRAGVLDLYEGHQAPVTGLDTHPGQGTIDFSHLFLTSSIDWTVKLWSLKENKPLYSFEDNGDYVYDAAWSPIHPALFAAVDGTGRLDLWNLNKDTEVSLKKTSFLRFDISPSSGCKRKRGHGGRCGAEQGDLDAERTARGRRGRPRQDLGVRRGGAVGRAPAR